MPDACASLAYERNEWPLENRICTARGFRKEQSGIMLLQVIGRLVTKIPASIRIGHKS